MVLYLRDMYPSTPNIKILPNLNTKDWPMQLFIPMGGGYSIENRLHEVCKLISQKHWRIFTCSGYKLTSVVSIKRKKKDMKTQFIYFFLSCHPLPFELCKWLTKLGFLYNLLKKKLYSQLDRFNCIDLKLIQNFCLVNIQICSL